jgi:hypothetical protein
VPAPKLRALPDDSRPIPDDSSERLDDLGEIGRECSGNHVRTTWYCGPGLLDRA